MTTHKEALKLARQLLWRYRHETPIGRQPHMICQEVDEAFKRIDEALAQPEQELTNLERHERNVQQLFGTQQPKEPEQEPVAHREGFWCKDLTCKKCYSADFRFKHTTPPQRKPKNLMQVKRISDQSIELVFTSCAAASEFENGIKE